MELTVSIAILAILMTLIIVISPKIFLAAGKPACLANMRNLHIALSSYIADNKMWPQQPQNLVAHDEAYDAFWINTLKPYLDNDRVWLCPTLERKYLKSLEGRPLKIHYIPTMFDAKPTTPYKWPTQPWLIEIANAHGDGGLILFPDGSIQSLGQILKQ